MSYFKTNLMNANRTIITTQNDQGKDVQKLVKLTATKTSVFSKIANFFKSLFSRKVTSEHTISSPMPNKGFYDNKINAQFVSSMGLKDFDLISIEDAKKASKEGTLHQKTTYDVEAERLDKKFNC